MMPESSTIRHVFMLFSLCQRDWTVRKSASAFACLTAWHSIANCQIQHAIGVKRDKYLLVEAKYPGCSSVQRTVEIDRGRLAIAVCQAEHFADAVHQDAKRFRSPLNADDHMRGGVPRHAKLKPICQIDHCDDATTQIDHARDFTARQRYARYVCQRENVLSVLNRQPKQLTRSCESNVIGHLSISPSVHAARPREPLPARKKPTSMISVMPLISA